MAILRLDIGRFHLPGDHRGCCILVFGDSQGSPQGRRTTVADGIALGLGQEIDQLGDVDHIRDIHHGCQRRT